MSVSLTKIDEKISSKRRALAEAIDARQEKWDALDELSEKIDALETDGDDKDALEASYKVAKSFNKEVSALGDQIRRLESEVSDLESDRTSRQEHNRQQASLNVPGERKSAPDAVAPSIIVPEAKVSVPEPTNEQKDHDISCFIRNMYIAKTRGMSLSAVCAGEAGPDFRNDRLHAVVLKSANPGVIPENYQARLIELLRPNTVCRKMSGVRQVPLISGNLAIPRQNGASSAAYIAENTNIAVSTPTTEQITLTAKKLTAMVIASGEMLRHANPSTDQMIRDDIVRVVSLKEDSTFIRAVGSATVPAGLKDYADNVAGTPNVFTANATVNVANVTTDLGKLILGLANADSPMLACHFLLHPRSERWLLDARDGNGNYAFPEMARGVLRGYPYMTTTQIPINLGAGTDESEVYFVDASEFIIGDAPTFELNVSTEAAYHDGANVQAAYSLDHAAFRMIVEHDTAMRHELSVSYLDTVTWGA